MSCHGNSYAVQNLLVWTFLDHIRTGQGNTGRICLLTIVWYVLSASERGIFKECKTFKAGKKKKKRKKKPPLSLKCLNTSLNRQAFKSYTAFHLQRRLLNLLSRREAVRQGSRAQALLFAQWMTYLLMEMSKGVGNLSSAFYSHILFPLYMNTENQEQLLWRNVMLFSVTSTCLNILGIANIHQDGTAKGQHGATVIQMESLQTRKIYFQVVCILRLLHDYG